MNRLKAGAVLTAVTMLVLPAPIASATPAGTDYVICDNPGQTWWSWSSVSKYNIITHATGYENYTGKDATYTKSMAYQTQASASASTTSSAAGSFGSDFLISKLEVQTSLSLQSAGSVTSTSTQSTSWTMKTGGTTIFYGGTLAASGNWKYNKCVSPDILKTSYGSVRSWRLYMEGGVFCLESVPSGSLAYRAKQLYC